MKLISWNVNGIRAAIKKGFHDFIEKEKPDIICIQETKARPEQVDKILTQYPFHYWNSAEKKGYSGTAVFSKHQPITAKNGFGLEHHDQEGRVITLEFSSYYLVNVYTPNSKRELLRLEYRKQWDADFLNYLNNLNKNKPVIVCGDLNVAHTKIDLANAKSNYNKNPGYTQTEIDGFANILNSGFIDSFRMFNQNPGHYTWWSYMFNARAKNIGWRIDYFCISQILKEKIKEATILSHIMGSDHCPIKLILES